MGHGELVAEKNLIVCCRCKMTIDLRETPAKGESATVHIVVCPHCGSENEIDVPDQVLIGICG